LKLFVKNASKKNLPNNKNVQSIVQKHSSPTASQTPASEPYPEAVQLRLPHNKNVQSIVQKHSSPTASQTPASEPYPEAIQPRLPHHSLLFRAAFKDEKNKYSVIEWEPPL
jgi:hypothetical protein